MGNYFIIYFFEVIVLILLYDGAFTLTNSSLHCEIDVNLIQDLLLYKPIVNNIMHIIKSKPISHDFYEKYSTFIDKFGSRPSGSETLERAIDYMTNLTIDSAFHHVRTEDVKVPKWIRGKEYVRMIHPRSQNIAVLGIGLSVSTPITGITAEVIVVNNFQELDYISNYYIQGKIVLVNAKFTTYQNTIKYRRYSAIKASEKGAVAVLIRSITPLSLYTLHTGDLVYDPNVKKIPAAAITIEDADLLQRIYNRGEVIVIKMKMLNSLKVKKSRNIIIDLKGYENPNKLVIVSGHIDSWDVGQGAIDDGGGMMISWFVPVILNYLNFKPKRTIRAILWTSAEVGLVGAAAYLKRHMYELDDINFIMESDEGTFKPLGLKVVGSKQATCVIERVLKLFAPVKKIKLAKTTGSDISLFVDRGIPGASLLNQDDHYFWYHHTDADTLSAQNMTNVVECAAFWAAISYVIADMSLDIPRY